MTRKKRIVRITTIPLSLNLLLKGQLKYLNQHFDVLAVSSPGKELEELKAREGVRISAIHMYRNINILHDVISFIRMCRLLYKESPEIVHSNTPKSSLIAMVAGWMVRIPVRIYTVTGLRYETEKSAKRFLLILMERLTCFFSTHVIAESVGVKQKLLSDNITSKNAKIIGHGNINGIDENYWNPELISESFKHSFLETENIQKDDFCYLFVGRIVKDKGVEELVTAFSLLASESSNTKLIVVGPMDETDSTLDEDILNQLNKHPQIRYLNFRSDIREIMAASHVFVLPSYREGFPNVLLQAGVMKLPIIVTDVHGTIESIDEKNGMIIEKKNSESLYNAMKQMRLNYAQFDKSYCRQKIVEKFSQQYYYPELLKFYQSL
ncbi:MAG: glycosyltransferase family 4 protein [Bacteroidetes bacterium]|nr:glycosyltransferase family 4 protein [Bacteroidota bacterium]